MKKGHLLEVLEIYLEDLVKIKAIERFKKEFHTASVNVTGLLADHDGEIYLTRYKAQEAYNKIEAEVLQTVIEKVVKKIKDIVK